MDRAPDFTCVVLDRVLGRPVFVCAIGSAAAAALGHDGQVGHVAGSGGDFFRQAGADSPSTHYSRKQSSCPLHCCGCWWPQKWQKWEGWKDADREEGGREKEEGEE